MIPKRIGIVGLGFGKLLATTLSQMAQAKVVAIADRSNDSKTELAAQLGAKAYDDAFDMLEKEDLDLLVLSIPPRGRQDLLQYAADKGIALFVEKPWASTSRQAELFNRIVEPIRNKTMLGFSFRFLPAFQKLLSLTASELGNPFLAQASYIWNYTGSSTTWLWDPENGNGFFNENSCHLFDAVNALMGKPISIHSFGHSHRSYPSEDAAIVNIKYPEGRAATLSIGGIGTAGVGDFPRLELWASNGHAVLTGNQHIWTDIAWTPAETNETVILKTAPESLTQTRYTKAFEHLFDCLDKDIPVEADIEDGTLCVRMAEAIYSSIKTDERVLIR
ncbi:Gfo/Idh/MocA family protein [Pelagicoccus mobilis]|uniref:Gfo/Idh/MocA family oxidoreductase n=1 Tax=Pelagicoccus mobilis TaxID=415221 RepID=A0A934RX65_9BACT|nr:Gfo/Idh/MocA family oxidoreductase [Pelagicoccus mobilis]MBK1875514.1 Gfo/Idh/MocA family oxidoreductase [Pelagicoccus mobilis]